MPHKTLTEYSHQLKIQNPYIKNTDFKQSIDLPRMKERGPLRKPWAWEQLRWSRPRNLDPTMIRKSDTRNIKPLPQNQIWRGRVRQLDNFRKSNLLTVDLNWCWDEVENAISDGGVCEKLLGMNTRNKFVRLVLG